MDPNNEENKDRVNRMESLFMGLRRTLFSNNALHRHIVPTATMSLVRILADHYGESKNPISVGSLGIRSGLSPSSVSQHLDIIEKHKGIIKRRPSATDKRVIEVIPTKRGDMIFARINNHRQHSKVLYDLIDFLGPDDTDELLRLLERVDEFRENRNSR